MYGQLAHRFGAQSFSDSPDFNHHRPIFDSHVRPFLLLSTSSIFIQIAFRCIRKILIPPPVVSLHSLSDRAHSVRRVGVLTPVPRSNPLSHSSHKWPSSRSATKLNRNRHFRWTAIRQEKTIDTFRHYTIFLCVTINFSCKMRNSHWNFWYNQVPVLLRFAPGKEWGYTLKYCRASPEIQYTNAHTF